MGLTRLDAAVARLIALRNELPTEGDRPGRWMFVVDQIETAMKDVQTRYELLKDRYALLKRSNAALCDELVWLRDQIDDLASGNPEE